MDFVCRFACVVVGSAFFFFVFVSKIKEMIYLEDALVDCSLPLEPVLVEAVAAEEEEPSLDASAEAELAVGERALPPLKELVLSAFKIVVGCGMPNREDMAPPEEAEELEPPTAELEPPPEGSDSWELGKLFWICCSFHSRMALRRLTFARTSFEAKGLPLCGEVL
jgi:hypothetical protein